MHSWLPGGKGRTRCLSSPFPGPKNPTPGNQAKPSQHGAKVVIHSGTLHCVPPEGQAPQSQGRVPSGEETAAPIPSWCQKQAGHGGLRELL